MIFRIDESVSKQSVDVIRLFAKALLRAGENLHLIDVSPTMRGWIDRTIIQNPDHKYLGSYDCEDIVRNKELWDIKTMQKQNLRTVLVGYETNMISVEQMCLLVNEPSLVILENGYFDWMVLCKWVSLYKKDRSLGSIFMMVHKAITHHKTLRGHNAGGCDNIQNVMRALMPLYSDMYRFRLTTIFDSDKVSKEDTSEHHRTLKTFLNDKEIFFHELEKREIENYFPLQSYEKAELRQSEVLEDWNLEWDYVDLGKASFLQFQKSDIAKLCDVVEKEDLETIETEIKDIILHLAKYI